jgi:dihydrofolate reductase
MTVRFQSGTAPPARPPATRTSPAAGDKDVALMGGGALTSALAAGPVDEVVLHQVPVLLGAGRRYFQQFPEHVQLRLLAAVPAPGVTHLRYEVVR